MADEHPSSLGLLYTQQALQFDPESQLHRQLELLEHHVQVVSSHVAAVNEGADSILPKQLARISHSVPGESVEAPANVGRANVWRPEAWQRHVEDDRHPIGVQALAHRRSQPGRCEKCGLARPSVTGSRRSWRWSRPRQTRHRRFDAGSRGSPHLSAYRSSTPLATSFGASSGWVGESTQRSRRSPLHDPRQGWSRRRAVRQGAVLRGGEVRPAGEGAILGRPLGRGRPRAHRVDLPGAGHDRQQALVRRRQGRCVGGVEAPGAEGRRPHRVVGLEPASGLGRRSVRQVRDDAAQG